MFALGLAVLLLAVSCATGGSSVADLFHRYSEASASHDLETLDSLTADDIVWQLGPFTLNGKDEALGPNAYDAGAQTELTYRNVRVEGNVVTFELLETSEIIRAVGMTELHHYPRFEFENGLVVRKGPSAKKPAVDHSLPELNRRMAPLRKWIRETHPEAVAKLVDPNKGFVFSEDNGALMLRLTREWVASGAPGRLAN
jgi:hypothetical protein